MSLADELHLERELEILTLRSKNTKIFFGVFATGFSLWMMASWYFHYNGQIILSDWVGLLFILFFLCIGIYTCLPREVRTTFDLRSKEMERRVIFCNGFYERIRTYGFLDIEGLGVQKTISEDLLFTAFAKLKTGKYCGLSETSSSAVAQIRFHDIIQSVSDFTGLPLIELPTRGSN